MRSYFPNWRTSLAARFILLTVSLTALTLSITAWFSYYSYRQVYQKNLQTKAEEIASFVASITSDRLFSNDYSSLYNYVYELSQTKDIVYAVITDNENGPLTAYLNKHDPIVLSAIEKIGEPDISKVVPIIDQLPNIISVKAPIKFNRQKVGEVILGVDRNVIVNELLHILIWSAIGFVFIILMLIAGIYIVFRFNVLRPAKELMLGAQRVAAGDLGKPIELRSSDELGKLADSFNIMMLNLNQSYDERTKALDDLREFNRTLEIRIEERTRDVESANRELEKIAMYDSLTELPNRKLILDRLARTLKTSELSKSRFSVLLMDLDNFKEINDTFGHHFGDALLTGVSARLLNVLHKTDTIGRLGGDEFAIILPDTDKEGAVKVCEKIIKSLEQTEELHGIPVMVAASLGIAIYPEHGENASMLLKNADVAMYEAKYTKSGYTIYHRDIDTHSPMRIALMNDLRVAIETNQLQLYYQTITEIHAGKTCGVEALARWIHPDKGFIPPEKFIPMIEQTGLIRLFTNWVIDTALEQWAQWYSQGIEVVMSVNLSMRNLQDKEFPNELTKLIKKWSTPSHALMLEVTESAMMHDHDYVLKTLTHFRKLGVDIAIDDFGTGYSSLSYLKRLPVSKLKIDRTFVREMNLNKDDATIVRSTIDLAHNLGLTVVAEGVENEEILTMLNALKCDMAQGFYFSHPVPAQQIVFNVEVPATIKSANDGN